MANNADKIEQAITEMFTRESDYEKACREAAEAEGAYKLAKARAFLSATGTVDARKAKADIECETLMNASLIADATEKFTKQKLDDVRAAISARQSILS